MDNIILKTKNSHILIQLRNTARMLMEVKRMEHRVCPKCGEEFNQYPAISRVDNITEICPRCGMLESLMPIILKEDRKDEKK